MYEQLLAGIFEGAGKTSQAEQDAYLQSLKPVLTETHKSFQTQNVATDYTALETQACYLLRYFPVYSQLIKAVLKEIRNTTDKPFSFSDAQTIRSVFIGPGPCPEVTGLASFLKQDKFLIADLYDKYAWRHARDIVKKHVLPVQSPAQCTLIEHIENLLDAGFPDVISSTVAKADFLILQNCLNEVTFRDADTVEENIIRIITTLKSDKLAILIDRGKYKKVREILQRVEAAVGERGIGEVVLSVDSVPPRFDGVDFSHNAMPSSLYGPGMLFEGDSDGRRPTRFVDYIRLVVRRA